MIARLTRSQHGAVTRKQLLGGGVSERVIDRRLGTGRLERLHAGVYATASSPATWDRAAMAACLRFGPCAALSHLTAARVWGIVRPTAGPIDVLVEMERGCSRGGPGVRVHRSRSFTSADRAWRNDLPVTTIGRTLVDLAGVVDTETLAVALDAALCGQLADPGRLAGTLGRLANRGRRTQALRDLLEPWLEGAGVDSVAEGQFRRVITGAGLPPPVTRYEVFDVAGIFVARLDLAWPDRMLALEVDGYRYHASPRSFASDAERTNRLAALGWTVLRAAPAQLTQRPETVLAALRCQLRARPTVA